MFHRPIEITDVEISCTSLLATLICVLICLIGSNITDVEISYTSLLATLMCVPICFIGSNILIAIGPIYFEYIVSFLFLMSLWLLPLLCCCFRFSQVVKEVFLHQRANISRFTTQFIEHLNKMMEYGQLTLDIWFGFD